MDQIQLFLGPSHTDIAESPFLFHFTLIVQGTRMRENRFLQTGHEDNRKLEAFGSMECHQRNSITVKIRAIEITDQRNFFQEAVQTGILVLLGNAKQLFDVLLASLTLWRAIIQIMDVI